MLVFVLEYIIGLLGFHQFYNSGHWQFQFAVELVHGYVGDELPDIAKHADVAGSCL